METRITGRVWKYGDNVNTDVIFPGKYTYSAMDAHEMAQHALEDLDARFAQNVQAGDIIVAGANWGCGSSREQAVTCLKAAGIAVLVARSFARIYYRNSINQALPIVTCGAVDAVTDGDFITVDFAAGVVETPKGLHEFPPLPREVMEIMADGGLIPYVRKQLGVGR